jgi:hypothetical protein
MVRVEKISIFQHDVIQTQSVLPDPLPNLTIVQNNSLFPTYCKIPRRGHSKLQLFLTYLLLIAFTYCYFGSKT